MLRLGALLLLVSFTADASPTRFRVGPMTEFPSHSGVDGQLEISRYVHFLLQGGVFIGPYARALRDIGESLSFFDNNTGQLIEDLLPGALSVRAGVGSHDWLFRGFLMEFAYSYFGGGGDASSSAVLGTLINADLSGQGSNGTIPTSTQVHWLSVHVGYRLKFAPGWHFVTRLGLAHPISSSTTMELANAGPTAAAAFNNRLDQEMDRIYNRVWLPVLSFSVVFGLGTPDYPSASPDPRSI